jgi:hypothetical protein
MQRCMAILLCINYLNKVEINGRRLPPDVAQVRTCASLGANTCSNRLLYSGRN